MYYLKSINFFILKKNKIIFLYLYSFLRLLLADLYKKFKFSCFQVNYKIKFKNNNTFPVSIFPINNVSIGDFTYGPINIYSYQSENEGLVIGNYCSIARDVKFILGGNHRTDCLMTFPVYHYFVDSSYVEARSKGPIVLEDDVWIGVGCVLLSGIVLGQGCVVAAGSVVTKSFSPFSIIGGNPARLIKKRFNDEVINFITENKINFGIIKSEFFINNDKFNEDELTINKLKYLLKYNKQ